jgi:hypothetical protein
MDYSHHLHQQKPQLPPGWVETIDPNTGRNYYANATTGESSWDIPQFQRQLHPPPPPPPPLQHSLQQTYQYPLQQQQQSDINHQYRYSNTIDNENINKEKYHYSYPESDNRITYNASQPYPPEQQQQGGPAMPTQLTQSTHPANTLQNDVHNTNSNSVITTGCDTPIQEENDPINNELRTLSVGQIADLCYMQQQLQYDDNGTDSSRPLPYSSPLTIAQHQQRPRQEIGRLQTRYYSLMKQLKQFRIF